MATIVEKYINYITSVRRYSQRTCDIYTEVLEGFAAYCAGDGWTDTALLGALTPSAIRNYEVHLMEEDKESPRTVNLHLSVLSGFCRYLIHEGLMSSNPVRLVTRPKMEKRLPTVYREDSINEYFASTEHSASKDELELQMSCSAGDKVAAQMYERRLRRLIVSLLHGTGIRRSELISLNVSSIDFSREVMSVRGKGDKMREIPIIPSLCEEISLYLQSAESISGIAAGPDTPLLRTARGTRLYPVYVDRAVKQELGDVSGITGRKSPHVLRHTIATELLDEGTDLNSIKELLGHSSLAATQVYTHTSIEKLKKVYNQAHPRAEKGKHYGDKD